MCDKGNKVIFKSNQYYVIRIKDNKVIFISNRLGNTYIVNLGELFNKGIKCLSALLDNFWTWYRRLGHASMDIMNKLFKKHLVDDLPHMKNDKDRVCFSC